jgi:type IV secretory pathway TraG/TraD family ATPase VirD4
VVLFSLNSSVYGKLAAQLGTLAIQDLVSSVGHRLSQSGDAGRPPAQAVIGIDEFSALGADNVLALLARGREAGAAIVLATQELADLERAGPGFRDQVLGNTSVKLAHRQDVPASAQTIAQIIGTEHAWQETRQMQSPFGPRTASRGTRRQVEQYIVHPNEIKTLRTGQVVMISKTPVARTTRVQVYPPGHDPASSASGRGRGQADPGVTR